MKKAIFIISGILCVVLGSIGIVLPGLPTTPFLLLAAYLFYRSSKKMHKWLMENKILGKYLLYYFNNTPMPPGKKIFTIAFLWIGMGTTVFLISPPPVIIILLACKGCIVSFYVITLGKFKRTDRKLKSSANLQMKDH